MTTTTAGQVLYHVRVQSHGYIRHAGIRQRDAYVMRSADGLPVWTWIEPAPLPLGKAEQLRRDCARLTGGTLRLEEARPIWGDYIGPADA